MLADIGSREQIMALLSELKLLIHLGQHLNIVNLLGAYTHELNRGESAIHLTRQTRDVKVMLS